MTGVKRELKQINKWWSEPMQDLPDPEYSAKTRDLETSWVISSKQVPLFLSRGRWVGGGGNTGKAFMIRGLQIVQIL